MQENLILMTIDSLRPDYLGCFGIGRQTSPNIDAIARKGVVFSQAVSNGGGSATSFPSIMTSTYSMMNPNSGAQESVFWVKLSERWPTIAEVLRSNGFFTAAFINMKDDISSAFGYNRGLDLFDETKESRTISSKLHRKVDWLRGNKFVRADYLHEKIIQCLKNQQGRFFLWVHYMSSHMPYNPKGIGLLGHLKGIRLVGKIAKPENLSIKDVESLISLYEMEIEYLDSKIGMLLNNLEKMGISVDNTNFVILSDHGDQFMEHKEWGHGRLYEEVIRVPMIFCGPQIPKNTVIKEQVSLLDVAPTIFDIFKISTPSTFQGVSLLPLIDGKKIESDKHYVISEELGPDFSCRTEKWKYIRHDWTKTHELFRLEADPKEKKNVVSEFPDKVKELDAIISEHISMESNIAKTEEQECREFCEKNQKFMEEYARAHRKNPAFLNRISGSPRT